MPTGKEWVALMKGVPKDRYDMYRDMRENAGVVFSAPLKASIEAMDEAQNAFEQGSRCHLGVLYQWKLSRIPYYIEWRVTNSRGTVEGHVFQSVMEFKKDNFYSNRQEIVYVKARRGYREEKEFEDYVEEKTKSVDGQPSLDQTTARTLGRAHLARQKLLWQANVEKYIKSKGFDKTTLYKLPIPMCQMLAETFNNGQCYSQYLALTWTDYENDDELAGVRKQQKLLGVEYETGSSTAEKRKRKKSRKKKKKNLKPTDLDKPGTMSIQADEFHRSEDEEQVREASSQITMVPEESDVENQMTLIKAEDDFAEASGSTTNLKKTTLIIMKDETSDLDDLETNFLKTSLIAILPSDGTDAVLEEPCPELKATRKGKEKSKYQSAAIVLKSNDFPEAIERNITFSDEIQEEDSRASEDQDIDVIPLERKSDQTKFSDQAVSIPTSIPLAQDDQNKQHSYVTMDAISPVVVLQSTQEEEIVVNISDLDLSTPLLSSEVIKHSTKPSTPITTVTSVLPSNTSSSLEIPFTVVQRGRQRSRKADTVAAALKQTTIATPSLLLFQKALEVANRDSTGPRCDLSSTVDFPALGITSTTSIPKSSNKSSVTVWLQNNHVLERSELSTASASSTRIIDSSNLPYSIRYTSMQGVLSKKQRRQSARAKRKSVDASSSSDVKNEEVETHERGTPIESTSITTNNTDSAAILDTLSLHSDTVADQSMSNHAFVKNPQDMNMSNSVLTTSTEALLDEIPKSFNQTSTTLRSRSRNSSSSTKHRSSLSTIIEANTQDLIDEQQSLNADVDEASLTSTRRHTPLLRIDTSEATIGHLRPGLPLLQRSTIENSIPFPSLEAAPVVSGISQSTTLAARAIRASSLETIRQGLQRRLSSPSISPTLRARISSISGVFTPGGLGKSVLASPSLLPLSAVDTAVSEQDASSSSKLATSAGKSPASKAAVAVPDLKRLKSRSFGYEKDVKEADAAKKRSTSDAYQKAINSASVTGSDGNELTALTRSQLFSSLRASAPSFVPQHQAAEVHSQDTTAVNSPVEAINPSILRSRPGFAQRTIASKGLKVSFVMPPVEAWQKELIMVYPTDPIVNDPLSRVRIGRPWSASVSDVPSSTSKFFDGEGYKWLEKKRLRQPNDHVAEFGEAMWDETLLLQTWPRFRGGDTPLDRPWVYRDANMTAEEIVMNFGQYENHYRPIPYDFPWRSDVAEILGVERDSPCVVMKSKSNMSTPTVKYDLENQVWRIFPVTTLHPDVRQCDDHPDYIADVEKLLDWQALEMWGYRMYQSARMIHKCKRKDCDNLVRDDSPQTVPCLGCGPMARIRWCSQFCQFEDINVHWKECGHSDFMPPHFLVADDQLSFPEKFGTIFPLIQDIHGYNSKARYRLHIVHYYLPDGYALFPLESNRAKYVPVEQQCQLDDELVDRVHRLINCALLDHTDRPLLGYLFLLLRNALFAVVGENYGEYHVVQRLQFWNEFKFDAWNQDVPIPIDSISACDCMWFGRDNVKEHDENCGPGLSGPYEKHGLKKHVEDLERDHWILRVWRINHPNVFEWRERLYGKGFKGVKPKNFKKVLPVLGVGYDGHISKGKRVGDWRTRLTLDGPAPTQEDFKEGPKGAGLFYKEPNNV